MSELHTIYKTQMTKDYTFRRLHFPKVTLSEGFSSFTILDTHHIQIHVHCYFNGHLMHVRKNKEDVHTRMTFKKES